MIGADSYLLLIQISKKQKAKTMIFKQPHAVREFIIYLSILHTDVTNLFATRSFYPLQTTTQNF